MIRKHFSYTVSFNGQKLAAGVDPVEAFVFSAEAAVAGAESTKNMQAQVIIIPS